MTEEGADAIDGLLLESEIITPPVGAAVAETTVPVELFPLTTEFGENVSEDSWTVVGVMVIDVAPDFVVSWTEVAFTWAVVGEEGAV